MDISLPLSQVQADEVLTPPKRRRLRGKTQGTTDFESGSVVVPPRAVNNSSVIWSATEDIFAAMDERQRYFYIFNKLRFWLTKASLPSDPHPDLPYPAEAIQKARTSWKALPVELKAEVSRYMVVVTHAQKYVIIWIVNHWPKDKVKRTKYYIDAASILLTYQGSWGELPTEGLATDAGEQEIVDAVRSSVVAQKLWESFQTFILAVAERFHIAYYGASLEICSKTWKDEAKLRIHVHCFLRHKRDKIRAWGCMTFFWNGCLPHRSAMVFGRQLARSTWSGMYYVLCPKLFGVWSWSNVSPFVDFPVSPEWIFSLIEARKMGYEHARRQLIQTGKGLCRRLQDLDCWHRQSQRLALEDHAAQVMARFRQKMLPFPRVLLVDSWLQLATTPDQPRKSFLVLTGPSKMGKTEFVRQLFPAGSVLELNCAGVKHCCLQYFSAERHRCIMWDECSPKLVAEHRKVFQHGACWVDVGHSPTGQHVLKFWLNDTCSVIISNRWNEELSRMFVSDSDWVRANSVVIEVVSPLWLADDNSR